MWTPKRESYLYIVIDYWLFF